MLEKLKSLLHPLKTRATLARYQASYLDLFMKAAVLRACAKRLVKELEPGEQLANPEVVDILEAVDNISHTMNEGFAGLRHHVKHF
jgi:hypothetical protein